jgi:hypothetical protein
VTHRSTPPPLALRGSALTALSTGEEARNLRELRAGILRVPSRSLYYHFWGRLLRPVLVREDYVNDSGNWVGHELRDPALAERLALVDPEDTTDIETLRERMAELLEERVADGGPRPESPPDRAFHFLEGQIVIFDTGLAAEDPAELARLLPGLPPSSVYYHLIDARHRGSGEDGDLREWLEAWGDPWRPLADAIRAVDVYFSPLAGIKEEVSSLFLTHARRVGS